MNNKPAELSSLEILSRITGLPQAAFADISSPRFTNIKTFACDDDGDEYSVILDRKGEVAQIKSNNNLFDRETVAHLLAASLMSEAQEKAKVQAMAEAAVAQEQK